MKQMTDYELVRYVPGEEVVFKSKDDLIKALQDLSSGNDIIITYQTEDILRTEILQDDIMTKFNSGDIVLCAEQKIS